MESMENGMEQSRQTHNCSRAMPPGPIRQDELVGEASPSLFEHTASRVSRAMFHRVPAGIIDHAAEHPVRFRGDPGRGSVRDSL